MTERGKKKERDLKIQQKHLQNPGQICTYFRSFKRLGALVLPSVQDVLAVSFGEPSLYIHLTELVEIIEIITDKLVGKREYTD